MRLVVALGITWVLDGLEVTLVGSVNGVLGERAALHLSESQIGTAASAYLFGAIVGAGIGGEYAAINSAIDELVPARLRGRIDPAPAAASPGGEGGRRVRLHRARAAAAPRSAHGARALPHDRPGVRVQRDLLHLRAALVAAAIGVSAEGRSLEELAEPGSAGRAPA